MRNNKEINELEKTFELPKGFYEKLLKEDDWTFVIKLHSLLEASLTHLLTEILAINFKDSDLGLFDKSKLEINISMLEMSGKKVGKVSLAHSLGLILEDQKIFLFTLSEIRNLLIHKVKNVTFTFEEYTNALDKNQRNKFVEAFKYGVNPTVFISAEHYSNFPLKKPKLAIWFSGLVCLGEIYYAISGFQKEKQISVLKEEMNDIILQLHNKEIKKNS